MHPVVQQWFNCKTCSSQKRHFDNNEFHIAKFSRSSTELVFELWLYNRTLGDYSCKSCYQIDKTLTPIQEHPV